MCRCGFNGGSTTPIQPIAPNLALTYVPTIQTPTQQVAATNGTCCKRSLTWFDGIMLFLALIVAVNVTKS